MQMPMRIMMMVMRMPMMTKVEVSKGDVFGVVVVVGVVDGTMMQFRYRLQ